MEFKTTTVMLWATVAHFVADWMFQTEWMAINKMNLRSPAGWVHSAIHTAFLTPVFWPQWYLALLIGAAHLLIDTRKPVDWWMRSVKHVPPGAPGYDLLRMWLDQVFHIVILAIVVLTLVQG